MPSFTIYCDECDAGYDVVIEENEIHDRPLHCSYCGSELKDENVTSEGDWEDFSDDIDSDDDSRY